MLPDSTKRKTPPERQVHNKLKRTKGRWCWLLETPDPSGFVIGQGPQQAGFTEATSGSQLRFWISDGKDLKTTRSVCSET